VRVLIDAQLPPALAHWLTAAGVSAVHVHDLGLISASDVAIWQHAIQTTAVIVTKDGDFAARARVAAASPPVVWIRYGNLRRVALLERFAAAWPTIAAAIARGDTLIEIR
jgi:predicted nuclease of predicted toxin-antitoxin system